MNINYNENSKHKNIFDDIFELETIFNKFKIEDSTNGEYISLQNIKYSIFYMTKRKIKKKELVKFLHSIRKEISKNELLNKIPKGDNCNSIRMPHILFQSDKSNYSYNLIEKSEYFILTQKIFKENKNLLKISDYDMILEFYYNLALDQSFVEINLRKLNEENNTIENEIIENDLKITFEIFRKKILELFPNIEETLIKSCFDRLDMENLGYIKISSLEKFFII